jgi:hypothetical protein
MAKQPRTVSCKREDLTVDLIIADERCIPDDAPEDLPSMDEMRTGGENDVQENELLFLKEGGNVVVFIRNEYATVNITLPPEVGRALLGG